MKLKLTACERPNETNKNCNERCEFLCVSVLRVWRSFGIERAALIFVDFEKKEKKKKDVEDLYYFYLDKSYLSLNK